MYSKAAESTTSTPCLVTYVVEPLILRQLNARLALNTPRRQPFFLVCLAVYV